MTFRHTFKAFKEQKYCLQYVGSVYLKFHKTIYLRGNNFVSDRKNTSNVVVKTLPDDFISLCNH
jgi:hypothetical protein